MPEITITLPKLYPWQQEAVHTTRRHRLLIVSRQAGKTTAAQVAAVREAVQGRKVLWCAPVHKQVVENFEAIEGMLSQIIVQKRTPTDISIQGGGKIYFRSANKPDSLRGPNFDLVIFDEYAFADEKCDKVLWPLIVKRKGRFMGISSPNGHNFAYDLWEKHKNDPEWLCMQLPWTCSPHLDPAEIAKTESSMLPSEFRQEFLAEFVQPKGALFDPEWFRDIFVDAMPEVYQRSCIGVDPSLGRLTSDWQAVTFLGFANGVFYADAFGSRMPLAELTLRVKQVYEQYHAEGVAFESNGFQSLIAHDFLKLFTVPPVVWELDNRVHKQTRISRLSTLLARKQLKILNNAGGRLLYRQLADFPLCEDDLPDSLEMAWRSMTETAPQ